MAEASFRCTWFTSSSSCLNLLSCVSNWRLCSSRIFMRASSRVLCCLKRRASASMSLSTSVVPEADAPPWCGMGVASSGDEEKENDMEGDCCERNRSYSACKVAFSSSSSLLNGWNAKSQSHATNQKAKSFCQIPDHCFNFLLVIRIQSCQQLNWASRRRSHWHAKRVSVQGSTVLSN